MERRPPWQGALLLMLGLALGTSLGLVALARSYSALIEAKGKGLVVQGEVVAALIGAVVSADAGSTVMAEADALPPERIAPILRRLLPGAETRARVYGRDHTLLFDSAGPLRGQAGLTPNRRTLGDALDGALIRVVGWCMRGGPLPSRRGGVGDADIYPEVRTAMSNSTPAVEVLVENGEEVVSVAVPILVKSAVRGVLLLTARAGA